MNKLSDDQLWERVKDLVGRTVVTNVRGNPNYIEKVTDTKVRIRNRHSSISRRQIEQVYAFICAYGRYVPTEYRDGKYAELISLRFVLSVTPAIVAAAVPEQVEVDGAGVWLRH